jgi:site-specific DNA-methyltransferase (adenine-specific)
MTPYYSDDYVTIYHGDCREIDAWKSADVLVTDPPYGETSLRWDQWPTGWPSLSNARQLWCFGSMRMFFEHLADFDGWRFAQDIVWEKQNGSGFASDRFKRVHEVAVHWYRGSWPDLPHDVPRVESGKERIASFNRGSQPEQTGKICNSKYVDDGLRLMRSVVRVNNMCGHAEHPTQKPISIVSPLIAYSTTGESLIADPFMGSGTTLRAAKDLGRKAIGIELDERYCEIAAKRCAQEVLDFSDGAA